MFRRFGWCTEFKVFVLFAYLGFIWPRLLDDYMCIYIHVFWKLIWFPRVER
jgi:hypothetical protein